MLPFWLRRQALLLRDLLVNRERPDLAALARIEDPEAFVWAILPHAARTFAACIALMPSRAALPSAVAYLYCRMLDTYEDLVPSRAVRETSLRAFAARLSTTGGGNLAPAPVIADAADGDERDRAHLLLVQRSHLVDRVFARLDPATREVVRDLVRDMAEGMCWSSATFAAQGGVLVDEGQIGEYCRHVLGNPVLFGIRILRLHYGHSQTLTAAEHEDAMRVGEMVQLANVTRDVEKDLRRGIAYDPALRADLGRDATPLESTVAEASLVERCRAVRERLLRVALRRAPSYIRVIDALLLPRWSVARASAVLMLLFTERYYRDCARRAGLRPWGGPDATIMLIARAIPTTISARLAHGEMKRVEGCFLSASLSPGPAGP